jgi:hypothetical protein
MLGLVEKEIAEERYKICKSCVNFTSLKFCALCNCYMPFKTKLQYKKCPIDKWLAVQDKKEVDDYPDLE